MYWRTVNEILIDSGQEFSGFLSNQRKVSVVAGIDNVILIIKYDTLDGCRTNVKTDAHMICGHEGKAFFLQEKRNV